MEEFVMDGIGHAFFLGDDVQTWDVLQGHHDRLDVSGTQRESHCIIIISAIHGICAAKLRHICRPRPRVDRFEDVLTLNGARASRSTRACHARIRGQNTARMRGHALSSVCGHCAVES